MRLPDKYTSRKGVIYTVVSTDGKGGFTAAKPGGKTVKISGRLIARVKAAAENGATFKFQANGPQGGISYTVAIEAGVVYAVGLKATDKGWAL
jgi:hypothetical protein|tara:strand:- start:508 stop:786 length:279 start_codon:yes stop_codon:yes gene_type:complete